MPLSSPSQYVSAMLVEISSASSSRAYGNRSAISRIMLAAWASILAFMASLPRELAIRHLVRQLHLSDPFGMQLGHVVVVDVRHAADLRLGFERRQQSRMILEGLVRLPPVLGLGEVDAVRPVDEVRAKRDQG